MIENYSGTIENSFGTLDPGPNMHPKAIDLEGEKMVDQMNKYLLETHAKFNKS